MNRRQPVPVFNLDSKHKRDLWDFWSKNGWVGGIYDGCISWNEGLVNVPVIILQDIFFGVPVECPKVRDLTELGYIPFRLTGGVKEVFAPPAATPKPEPPKPPKVKKPPKPPKPPKVKKYKHKRESSRRACSMVKAFIGKIEVARAIKEEGNWTVILYEGIMEKSRQTMIHQHDVRGKMKNIPGVTKVKKIYSI